ncbi:IclR family transcriptional regulator C-terminal domain-containing protein [Mitsuaria sp. GD03876]|uniref:IclR family transcriptional regulator domain-containing protein n=1 Tax=Mitsuaria sp. GD03876 TaxID=2975399 RepID=UPI00244BBE99|nr:IclR family transcriptional regulator C-terminal domain-containing protein [Mitsuaria sp. GD03876]MDH0864345.1 helix-turn-helix domain-containing protein [Mitsuaria sp. GD03876]
MSQDESATNTPLKPGDSYVQSFARGLSVIRTFDTHHARQTLTDVAKRCGLTRAGARRILLTLQTLGYVRSEGRMFELTPKILDLGFAYLSSQPLWRFADPVAMQLANEVRESVSIAVLDGDDVVFVLRAPLRKIMSEPMGVGSRLPAWATATGRVLLASLPIEEREHRVAQAQIARRAGNTVRSHEELRAAVEQARRQHWCLVDQELEDGVLTIAVPITGRDGKVVAAINISTHASRTPPQVLLEQGLPKLQAAAQNLSQLLVLMKKD